MLGQIGIFGALFQLGIDTNFGTDGFNMAA